VVTHSETSVRRNLTDINSQPENHLELLGRGKPSVPSPFLGLFFSDPEIVGDSGNGGDEPCGLELPPGLNRLSHIFMPAGVRRSGIH
jgi:hypothetical protein